MGKLRISTKMNLHATARDDLFKYVTEGLDFVKNAGFSAADFGSEILKPLGDNYAPFMDRVIGYTEETGFSFSIAHLPYSLKVSTDPSYEPIFSREMHNAIDAVAMLGVDYAVMHPNTITGPLSDFDRKASYDSVMAHLSPFVEHASRVGLNVVVENMRVVHEHYPTHRYCQQPDELAEVADALGIGVCWDFGHANICGIKQSEALLYLGSRVKSLHVNDNTAIDDDHMPPFVGNIDWRDAMSGLRAIGFDGFFNYEIATASIPAALREDFARYLVAAAGEILSYL
jgi:sugar phosphate isomerase/epimerase